MKIQVEFLSFLAKFIGERFVELEIPAPHTVGKMIETLSGMYPGKFAENFLNQDGLLKGSVILLINGINASQAAKKSGQEDMNSLELHEDDEIAFIVPFGGG